MQRLILALTLAIVACCAIAPLGMAQILPKPGHTLEVLMTRREVLVVDGVKVGFAMAVPMTLRVEDDGNDGFWVDASYGKFEFGDPTVEGEDLTDAEREEVRRELGDELTAARPFAQLASGMTLRLAFDSKFRFVGLHDREAVIEVIREAAKLMQGDGAATPESDSAIDDTLRTAMESPHFDASLAKEVLTLFQYTEIPIGFGEQRIIRSGLSHPLGLPPIVLERQAAVTLAPPDDPADWVIMMNNPKIDQESINRFADAAAGHFGESTPEKIEAIREATQARFKGFEHESVIGINQATGLPVHLWSHVRQQDPEAGGWTTTTVNVTRMIDLADRQESPFQKQP